MAYANGSDPYCAALSGPNRATLNDQKKSDTMVSPFKEFAYTLSVTKVTDFVGFGK